MLPSVDEVADYAARLNSRLGLHRLGQDREIRVSRFAGTAAHARQLDRARLGASPAPFAAAV